MNLDQATAAINSIPNVRESIPELMKLVNGANPNIPGYMALGKLQQIKQLIEHSQQPQVPQGTIKDTIERSVASMATMNGRQQAAQSQMMNGAAQAGPIPGGVPQPVAQPGPDMGQDMGQPPMMAAAGGGILHTQMDPSMFNFAPGGIVSFAKKGKVEDEEKKGEGKELSYADEMRNLIGAFASVPGGIGSLIGEGVSGAGNAANNVGDYISANAGDAAKYMVGAPGSSRPFSAPGPTVSNATADAYQRPQETSANVAEQQDVPPGWPPKQPPPPPAANPFGSAAAPPARPTAGPLAPSAGAPQNQAAQVAALARGLTTANPLLTEANAASNDITVPKVLTDKGEITREQELNKSLGIGTFGENRRAQRAQLRSEFEKSRPSQLDNLIGMGIAASRPGSLSSAIAETGMAQSKEERDARMKFAEAEDTAQNAIEAADEAIRTGNKAEIQKRISERDKAIATAQEARARLKAENARTQQMGLDSAMQTAGSITHANITAVGQVKAAEIHAAAVRAGVNKPSELDKFKADASQIWEKAEKNKPGSGEAAVNAYAESVRKAQAALLGTKYEGQNKSVEHEKIIQDEIKSRTSMIDQKLQQPNLKPEERAKHLARRKEIEQGIRADFANRFPQSAGTATGGAADPLGIR